MTGQLLCIVDTPNGNIIELRVEGGVFKTRVLLPQPSLTIGAEQAREWYETAKRLGGCICANFPDTRRVA
jgi:hypothetical protein